MNKIKLILDEVTIINFNLIYKLILRYVKLFYIAIVILFVMFIYIYLKQPIVYSITIPIKTVATHTVSKDLSALLPVENLTTINLSELNVALTSFAFLNMYAEKLILDRDFDKTNFSNIYSDTNFFGSRIKSICKNNKDCILGHIVNLISSSFIIEQGATEDRFNLTLTSLSEQSTMLLAKNIVEAIEESRINSKQYIVKKELDSVTRLIKEGRNVIEKLDGFSLLQENEKIQSLINDSKDKLKTLKTAINNEFTSISLIESRLSELEKSKVNAKSDSKQNRLKEISILYKIDELRKNIASMSLPSTFSNSSQDEKILNDLKKELKTLEFSIDYSNRKLSSFSVENIIIEQSKNQMKFEFDYLVSKRNLEKLKLEFDNEKIKYEQLNNSRLLKEAATNKLKADFEFLKTLEAKQLSLKLLSGTMTSDLLFEKYSQDANVFRRSSPLKIFSFCLVFILLIFLILIIMLFYFDNKIYSDEDLKLHFPNLEFIGEVPKFKL